MKILKQEKHCTVNLVKLTHRQTITQGYVETDAGDRVIIKAHGSFRLREDKHVQ